MNSKKPVLGVDLGEKKIGLAQGYGQDLIFGSKTIFSKDLDDSEIAEKIKVQIEKDNIKKVVFGLPLSKDGRPTNQSRWVKAVARKLNNITEAKIEFVDEYLTSWQARTELGKDADIDQQSAVLILKDYFDNG
jgi:putative Holliday junction resolvase